MTKTTKKTAKLCGGCNADFSARSITPSSKTPGMCTDCAPDHTTHLKTAGTYDTFCGKRDRDLDPATNTVKVYEALFGTVGDVNCTDCMRVLRDRKKRGN